MAKQLRVLACSSYPLCKRKVLSALLSVTIRSENLPCEELPSLFSKKTWIQRPFWILGTFVGGNPERCFPVWAKASCRAAQPTSEAWHCQDRRAWPNTPGETTLWRKLATVSRLGQSDKVARWVQLREIQQGTTAVNSTYSGAQVAANLIPAFAQTPLFRFTKAMRETLKSGSGSGLWIPSAKPWTRSLPQTPEGI